MNLSDNLSIDRYAYAEHQLRSIPVLPNEHRVLFDIGAGDARFCALASESWQYVAFDREGWRDVIGWNLIEPCPRPNPKADAVFLLDVIEHLPNPGIALQNISNAMNNGGLLVVTTPNPRWSGTRINLLFRGCLGGFSEHDLEENYHVLPIWPHVLERFLGESDFSIKSYETLDGPTTLFGVKGNRTGPIRFILNAIQILIEAIDPSAKGMSYGVVAEKRPALSDLYHYPSASENYSI